MVLTVCAFLRARRRRCASAAYAISVCHKRSSIKTAKPVITQSTSHGISLRTVVFLHQRPWWNSNEITLNGRGKCRRGRMQSCVFFLPVEPQPPHIRLTTKNLCLSAGREIHYKTAPWRCCQQSWIDNALLITLASHIRLLHVHRSWHGSSQAALSVTIFEPLTTMRVQNCAGSCIKCGCWRNIFVLVKFLVAKLYSSW